MGHIHDATPRFCSQVELQGNMVHVSIEGSGLEGGKVSDPSNFDDDGRIKRQGTLGTASAHIITAVIGSGVLSLAWATAQLGWIAGPVAMLSFSLVTYYTSCLLSDCYRSPGAVPGKRNYTYIHAVRANLDGFQVWICGFTQYANMFGTAIGYTIAASISMTAIEKSNCFSAYGDDYPCHVDTNPYLIAFGVVEVLLSQIPDFHQIWWLSVVAAVMSFTYSTIGLGLGIAKVAEAGHFRGSLTGATIGTVSKAEKIWNTFQALGNIAFAYSYSLILIEIQDTIKSPPAENKTMKKATLLGVAMTTVFYMLCGCMGYAAFGDNAPGNLLTGFGFYNPFWLIDIANAAVVIHLVGAYQIFCQPLFAFIESWASKTWQDSDFINHHYMVPIPLYRYPGAYYKVNLFRLVWRTAFVASTTSISMLLPFFNNIVGLLGAMAFWPLTVYFPVSMYISQNKIRRWSSRWVVMQMLSVFCFIISLLAAGGSIVGIVEALKAYKPFQTA
eukprot:PITA_20858